MTYTIVREKGWAETVDSRQVGLVGLGRLGVEEGDAEGLGCGGEAGGGGRGREPLDVAGLEGLIPCWGLDFEGREGYEE